MTMGKLLSLLLPCCVKAEETEPNPKQRLVGENVTQSSYSSTPQDVHDTQAKQSYPEDSLEKSSTSVYYTPSSSITASTNTERPSSPDVKETNSIPC
ncbi:hypothetical protein ACROYT_G023793 [Oculina patagonica]